MIAGTESTTVATDGLEISTAGAIGNGRRAVVTILAADDEPSPTDSGSGELQFTTGANDEPALIDVEHPSLTRLGNAPTFPLVCPSADTFIVGTGATGPIDDSADPNAGTLDAPSPTGGSRSVAIIHGDRVETVPLAEPGPSTHGWASAVGCAEDGLIVPSSNADDRPRIIVVDRKGTPLSVEPSPDAPPVSGRVSYGSDMTGTALVAFTLDDDSGGRAGRCRVGHDEASLQDRWPGRRHAGGRRRRRRAGLRC